MSVLDTFYTLFKADTSDLDKGVKESDNLAQKLIKTLDGVDKSATGLGGTFMQMAVKGAALIGVGLSLKSIASGVKETAAANFELQKLADRFGTTADAIDEFMDAGELLGLKSEQTKGGLEALDRAVQDTALGLGRAKKVFEEIGIEVQDATGKVKPITTVMEELQGKFKGMEKGKQMRIMERLGLDPALLKLFNADMGDLQKRMTMIDQSTGFSLDKAVKNSKAYTKANKEMNLEVKTLSMYFGKLTESYNVSIMPLFTKGLELATRALKVLVEFAMSHTKFVEGGLIAIASAITYFLLPAAIRGAIATIAMIAPFLAVAAIVALVAGAFALAYDDIMNFIEGNDSLIGQFLDEYPAVRAAISTIGDVFEWLGGVIKDIAEIYMASWKMAFDFISSMATPILEFFGGQVTAVGQIFSAVGELVAGIFRYWMSLVSEFLDKFGGIVGIAKAVGGAISGGLGKIKESMGIAKPDAGASGPRQSEAGGGGAMGAYGVPGLAQGKAQLTGAAGSGIASQGSGAIANSRTTNKSTSVSIDKIEVKTQATDAAGISKSIGDSMTAQMRQAASKYDDGVAG